MPTLDISCPNCRKAMKVPDTAVGKKIRCKNCEHVFPVAAPSAKALPDEFKKAAPAKAKPKPAKPAAPPPAEELPIKFLDDEEPPKKPVDDDDEANPYGVIKEGEVPRCPHCAKELDPPDTKVCLHCGYDMVKRRRHESKKVYEHTQGDYFMYWLPGIIWSIVIIALITTTVIVWLKMKSWMDGSFLQKDEVNPTTLEKEFYVGPGCFITLVTLVSLAICVPGVRVVYKRFIKNWRPPEVEKKK